jgi:hypothetical protein
MSAAVHARAWVLFVEALLDAPEGSEDREVGKHIWELSSDEEILVYLTEQMKSGPGSRRYVVARTVWALLRGNEVAA